MTKFWNGVEYELGDAGASYRKSRCRGRRWLAVVLGGLCGITLVPGCSWFRPAVPGVVPTHARVVTEGAFLAGAAAVDITPANPEIYLGGYHVMRRGTGVHDPLYCRAVALQRGELQLVLVAVDVVGLQYQEVLSIQALFDADLDPRSVIIAATHNHNGPDTLGIWGFPPFISGIDENFRDQLREGVVRAIREARAALRPAEIAVGSAMVPARGILKNYRRPFLVDRELVYFHLRELESDATIATVVELGVHPEVLERWNTEITADFPAWTVRRLEQQLGGVGIYVSGALGGLVAPDVKRSEPPDPAEEWREAERLGSTAADIAITAITANGTYTSTPTMGLWHTPLYLQNDNFNYDLIRFTGLLDRDFYGSGFFRTEVNLWQLGPLKLATVPGEITPDLGLRIKRGVFGEPAMLVGLGNDELGYLLPSAEFDHPMFDYERTLCPGAAAGERVVERLCDLGLLSLQGVKFATDEASRTSAGEAPQKATADGDSR